jgi:phosphatidylglycerophosphate synthase
MSIRHPAASTSPALVGSARTAFAWGVVWMIAAAMLLALGNALAVGAGAAGVGLFTALLGLVDRHLAAAHPHDRFGRANQITLLRAGIACLLAARVLDPAPVSASERWVLAAVAAAALLLDGADGWAARRDGLCSPFGARFDMETDAFAILVLCALAVKAAAVPGWAMAIGTMRYVYVVAGIFAPVLRGTLPDRPAAKWRRKTIAVCQSVALIAALTPLLDPAGAVLLCAAALALLAYSFAADTVLLLSEA